MTILEYIPQALTFESKVETKISCALHPELNWARLNHAALGLATEAIELRKATTIENQLEELGDIAWFAALANDAIPQELYPADWKPDTLEPHTITHLIDLCELFASRIKAGLYYGYLSKSTDKHPLGWATIPMRLLGIIKYISEEHTRDTLFESNIAKLTARYREGFSKEAAQERDVEEEMEALTGAIAQPPEVQPEEEAQEEKPIEPTVNPKAAPKPEPSLADLINFTQANSRTGQITLGQ